MRIQGIRAAFPPFGSLVEIKIGGSFENCPQAQSFNFQNRTHSLDHTICIIRSSGPLVYWSIGLLVYWSIGPLVFCLRFLLHNLSNYLPIPTYTCNIRAGRAPILRYPSRGGRCLDPLHYIELHCIALHCIALHCTAWRRHGAGPTGLALLRCDQPLAPALGLGP